MSRVLMMSLVLAAAAVACQSARLGPDSGGASSQPGDQATSGRADSKTGTRLAAPPPPGLAVATFAGGCFWCMEPPFDKVQGVKSTTSGYAGGAERHPTYKQVAYGRTGHTETVRVVYDPKVVTYAELLDVYWRNVDPTDPDGQFVDRGRQYRPVVFVHDEEQRTVAEASKKALAASGRFKADIAVTIETAGDFWEAEDYHQDFYKKSPGRYYSYRRGSGRDQFIARVWKRAE